MLQFLTEDLIKELYFGVTNLSPNETVPVPGAYPVCAHIVGNPKSAMTIDLYCPVGLAPGQFIIVQQPGSAYLGFCELEVYVNNVTNLRMYDS